MIRGGDYGVVVRGGGGGVVGVVGVVVIVGVIVMRCQDLLVAA